MAVWLITSPEPVPVLLVSQLKGPVVYFVRQVVVVWLVNSPETGTGVAGFPTEGTKLTHLKRVPVLLVSPLKGPVVYFVRQEVVVWPVGQVTPAAVLVVPVGSRVTRGILD